MIDRTGRTFTVTGADHTGNTVSDLDRALIQPPGPDASS
ncbi:hypothetical protein SHXM_09126 [Streptomyces hygroscopicus]|nr:hypothetical protein SHXM_09126 [Streptomyces hygroscopicus]